MSIDDSNQPFDSKTDSSTTDPGESTTGAGGDDMAIWLEGRETKLAQLVGSSFSNNSSFEVPNAVTDTNTNPYDSGRTSGENFAVDPADSTTGAGGDVMAIWLEDRETKLAQLVGSSFSNNSSFGVPNAVTDTSTNPYDYGRTSGETLAGISGSILPLAGDGSLLYGSVLMIDDDNNIVASSEGEGTLSVNAPPTESVVDGATGTAGGGLNFYFVPSIGGIAYEEKGVSKRHTAGTVQYGNIKGKVTDYTGSPVAGTTVAGPRSAAKTDESGNYEFTAPGGTQVSLTAVGKTDSYTLTGGSTLTQDFQFGSILIEVLTPDYEGVGGVPVAIGNDVFETNDEGRVRINDALVSVPYVITVSDFGTITKTVESEGAQARIVVGTGGLDDDLSDGAKTSAVKFKIVDGVSGQPVANAPVRFESGVVSKSNARGRAKNFTTDTTDVVTIAEDDSRYRTERFDISLVEGETVEEEVTLQPQNAISQT